MADEDTLRSRRKTPRLLAEFVVIALGVFMGLAADAAWGARKDRGAEAEYLQALHVELGAAAEELAEDHDIREEMLAAADSLGRQFAQRSVPDSLVARWVENFAFRLRKFAPPSAVLDELVSSGNLRLLQSSELRFALMEYQRERNRLSFLEDRVLAATEESLLPYLRRRVGWLGPEAGSFPRSPRIPPSAAELLIDDPEFRNSVFLKATRLSLLQRRSSALLEEVRQIRLLVERQMR